MTGRGNSGAEAQEMREWRVLKEQEEVHCCQPEEHGEMMSVNRKGHDGSGHIPEQRWGGAGRGRNDDTGVAEAEWPREPCCEFEPRLAWLSPALSLNTPSLHLCMLRGSARPSNR